MSGQHTQGRLKAVHDELRQENGRYRMATRITACGAGGNMQQDVEAAQANARRLAACWNACDGISTEDLEKMAQAGAALAALRTTSAAPAAWMHPDGRVVSAATMTTARRDGGAMASSLSGYVTPLVPAADVRDAIERAAQICEATCVCDDGTEDYEINWVLRNRAAKIRALFTTSAAPADAEKGGA